MNLPSRLLMMLVETSHNFATYLRNNEQMWCQLGRTLFDSEGESGILRELVNDNQGGLKVAHLWDTLPRSRQNKQGFEKPKNFCFLHLILLTYEACLRVLHDIVLYIRPKVAFSSTVHRSSATQDGWPSVFFLRSMPLGTYNRFPLVNNRSPSTQNWLVLPDFAEAITSWVERSF